MLAGETNSLKWGQVLYNLPRSLSFCNLAVEVALAQSLLSETFFGYFSLAVSDELPNKGNLIETSPSSQIQNEIPLIVIFNVGGLALIL